MNYSSDDEWFYASIRRYRTLQMYDLQMIPYRMVRNGDQTLIIAGLHPPTGKTEIMEIKLPKKLFLTSEEEGRCKSNDFEINAGGFFSRQIHSLAILPEELEVIASFNDVAGLVMLGSTSVDSRSVYTEKKKILQDSDMISPNTTVCPSQPEILVAKEHNQPFFRVDCSTGNTLESISIPKDLTETPGSIAPTYSSSNTCLLLHSRSGQINAIDLRTLNVTHKITPNLKADKFVFSTDQKNTIGLLSSKSNCVFYDLRSTKTLIAETGLELSNCNISDFKLDIADGGRVSISGFGSSVFVYDIRSSELVSRFTHEGHSKLDVMTVGHVSDHLWLPNVADNFLVSCAINGTLNCWDYV